MTWAPAIVEVPASDQDTMDTVQRVLAELAASGLPEPWVEATASGALSVTSAGERWGVEVHGRRVTARVVVKSVTYYTDDEPWEMTG